MPTRPRRRENQETRPAASRPGRRAPRLGVVLVNVGLFALLVTLAEVGARTFARRDLGAVFDDPQVFVRKRPFIEPHPTRGFALRAASTHGEYRVNAHGFRGPELPDAHTGRAVVVALGESSTFGWGVAESGTYPARLQAHFDATSGDRGPVVLNAGVPSYTTPQLRAYLDEILARYRPAVVVVGALWNDALFACLPNWMPDYLVKQQPAAWRATLLRRSALYRAFALDAPGAAAEPPSANDRAVRYYADNLVAMARACRRAGTRFFLLQPSIDASHIPPDGMKIGRRTIPPAEFVALLDRFTEALEMVATHERVPVVRHRLYHARPEDAALFLDPVHPNAEGQAIVAEAVAQAIEAEPRLTSAAHLP
jgi:lysophospholipase L1-like esterase